MISTDSLPAEIGLRPETAGDRGFLETLFVGIRWSEFDVAGWPDSVRAHFLAQQFALQTRHYAQTYVGGFFGVVERKSAPIGRLYLYDASHDLRLIDISLIGEARGAGLGTAVLRAIQHHAAAAGQTVSLSVEGNNPARRLYHRLGFEEVGAEGPYTQMSWRPSGRDGA